MFAQDFMVAMRIPKAVVATLVHESTNAILMSFSSYPASVEALFPYLYHDPAPFARDAALVAGICDINRTPNARAAFYWMQRALHFDFAIPDVTRIKSVAVADPDRLGTRRPNRGRPERHALPARHRGIAARGHRRRRPLGTRGEARRRQPGDRVVPQRHPVVSPPSVRS